MQYSQSRSAMANDQVPHSSTSPERDSISCLDAEQRKRQLDQGQMNALNEELLREAYTRALSGGKSNHQSSQVSDPCIILDSNKNAELELMGQKNSNDRFDFSNNYVPQRRNKSKHDITTSHHRAEEDLQRPAFIQKQTFQAKQVYLYEQAADTNEVQVVNSQGNDTLFIQLENPDCKDQGKYDPTGADGAADDTVSQETKSQFTDASSNVQKLKSLSLLRQAAHDGGEQARSHLDDKRPRVLMETRGATPRAHEQEAVSQISEINFYQDLQDNSQLPHCTQTASGTPGLVVLDVDRTEEAHQGSQRNQRELLLASKRPHTAYGHDPSAGAPGNQIERRKRSSKADRDRYAKALRAEKESLYRVDYQNDLLNIVAQNSEQPSLPEFGNSEAASHSGSVPAEWATRDQHRQQNLKPVSMDTQYAQAIRATPGKEAAELPHAIHQSESVHSQYAESRASRTTPQQAALTRSKRLAQGFIASATATQSRGGNAVRGAASRQGAPSGIKPVTAIVAERGEFSSVAQLSRTPTAVPKSGSATQGRLSYKARDKSQLSTSKLPKASGAPRVALKSPAPCLAKSPGLTQSHSAMLEPRSASSTGPGGLGLRSMKSGNNTGTWTSKVVTPEQVHTDMVAAFAKVRLDLYSDILRIKKPQSHAFTAAQMLCKLVNSFRGGSQKTNNDGLFQDWHSIQDFVHKKPNVIKFHQEITQLIQHMILSQDYLNQLKHGQLKNHLNKLMKIQDQYFGLTPHELVLRQFQTNKNFQQIVNVCFTVTRYVLHEAGKTHLLNLGQHPAAEEDDTCSNNTNRTFLTSKMPSQFGNSVQRNKRSTTGSVQQTPTPSRDGHNTRHSRNTNMPRLNTNTSAIGQDHQQSASRHTGGVRGSLCKSPMTGQNMRSLMKTPRNDEAQCLSTKSPLTQKYGSRKNMNSASRSFKDGQALRLGKPRQQASQVGYNSKKGNDMTPTHSQTRGWPNGTTPVRQSHGPSGSMFGTQSQQSVEENKQNNSQKLYEIMLEKQKKVQHDRYARLTTSSVSKQRVARQQATPNGSRPGASEATSVNQTPLKDYIKSYDLKTPTSASRSGCLQQNNKQLEQLHQALHRHKQAGPPITPYEDEIKQQNTTETDIQSSKDSCSTRKEQKQRKSRKERSAGKPAKSVQSVVKSRITQESYGESLNIDICNGQQQCQPEYQEQKQHSYNTEAQMVQTNSQYRMMKIETEFEQKYGNVMLPLQNSIKRCNNEQIEPSSAVEAPAFMGEGLLGTQQLQNQTLPTGVKNLQQLYIAESSEEGPDTDILDQMQMIAPAPLPQPAPPLELTNTTALGLSTYNGEGEGEDSVEDVQQQPFSIPNQVEVQYKATEVTEQVQNTNMSMFEQPAETPTSQQLPSEVVSPQTSEVRSINHAKNDDAEAVNVDCTNDLRTVEVIKVEVQSVSDSSSHASTQRQQQLESSPEKTVVVEESSPEKSEAGEFDPFVEAQRIAAIIKADCVVSMVRAPEDEEVEECEAAGVASQEASSLDQVEEVVQQKVVSTSFIKFEPIVESYEEEQTATVESPQLLEAEPVPEGQLLNEVKQESESDALSLVQSTPRAREPCRQSIQSGTFTVKAKEEETIGTEKFKLQARIGFHSTSQSQDYSKVCSSLALPDQRGAALASNCKKYAAIEEVFAGPLDEEENQSEAKQESIYGECRASTLTDFQPVPSSRGDAAVRIDLEKTVASKAVEPSPLITPRTTQGLVIGQVVGVDGEAVSIDAVSKFESQQSRAWSSAQRARQDQESKAGASHEQDQEASATKGHDAKVFDEDKSQESPNHDAEDAKETNEVKQATALNVPVLALALQVPATPSAGAQSQRSSAGNSEMCMQEIVSPFRGMNLGRDTRSNASPVDRARGADQSGWQINPIQVKRDKAQAEEEEKNESLNPSEYSSILYSSPGGPGSPCESPVRQAHLLNSGQAWSPAISTGKLKEHVSQSRAAIFEQILATQQSIEANSPTKSSAIDRRLIDSLKRRRLAQRAGHPADETQPTNEESCTTSKTTWGTNPWLQAHGRMSQHQNNVINRLKESIGPHGKQGQQE